MRLIRTAVAAIAVVAACAACSGSNADEADADGSTKAADAVEVEIGTFQYMPKDLAVDAGTTVTWTNDDAILHTVTTSGNAPEAFDLQLEDKGATASFTFDEPGTYTYVCSVHPGMQATVTVR